MSNEQKEKALEIIDQSNKAAKVHVDLRDSLRALEKNAHFKKLILEGYLIQEAANKTKALASPALQGAEQQQEIINALQGIGHFSQYLSNVIQRGNAAEDGINNNNAFRSEVESGEADLSEMGL
jgi:hypothetical protein